MVVYQGGKTRLGRRIHDVIVEIESDIYGDEKMVYFEPFVGMAGVLTHFGKDKNRPKIYACDANKDIILMWKALQKGWIPPLECTQDHYDKLKASTKHSAERGFIGTVASWGGIFFHAYRLKYKCNRNYLQEGSNGLMKILPTIRDVKFYKADTYNSFTPEDLLIYADPPYKGNMLGDSSSLFQKFDHENFWNTMREWSESNLVIISESSAPEDFICIWSATGSISSGKGRKVVEFHDNLYIHESLYTLISKTTRNSIKSI